MKVKEALETPVPPDATLAVHQDYVDLADIPRLAALKAEIERSGLPVRKYHPQWSGERFTKLEEFGRMVLEDLWSGVLRDPWYVSKEVWRKVLAKDPSRDQAYTDVTLPIPREMSGSFRRRGRSLWTRWRPTVVGWRSWHPTGCGGSAVAKA